jgi:hypothetical protein
MKERRQSGNSLRHRKLVSIPLGVVCILFLSAASSSWASADSWASSDSPTSSDEIDSSLEPPPPHEADSSQDTPLCEGSDSSQEPSSEKDMADTMHETVTSKFLDTADWLDTFFDDERVVDEEKKSTLRAYTTVSKREGESVDFNVRFRLRLALPGTRKRLGLLVSGDGDDDPGIDNGLDDQLRESFQGREEENASTSLWYSFVRNERRHLSASAGLRLSSGSLIVYAGPRYRQLFSYGTWDMRFIERFRYYTDNGWESRTILDVERPVFENCLFRTTFDGTWLEGVPGYLYNVNFMVYQPLKLNRALQYEWTSVMTTRPNHQLIATTFRVRYRQQFWKDWLFFETGPEISFPRTRDFDLTPGIYLRLEAVFGKDRSQFRSRDMIGDHRIDARKEHEGAP